MYIALPTHLLKIRAEWPQSVQFDLRKFRARPNLISCLCFGYEVCRVVVSRLCGHEVVPFSAFLHSDHLQLDMFHSTKALFACTPQVRLGNLSEEAVLLCTAILAKVVLLPDVPLLLSHCRTARPLRSKDPCGSALQIHFTRTKQVTGKLLEPSHCCCRRISHRSGKCVIAGAECLVDDD